MKQNDDYNSLVNNDYYDVWGGLFSSLYLPSVSTDIAKAAWVFWPPKSSRVFQ